MADSFNLMQAEVGRAAVALDGAREGLRDARGAAPADDRPAGRLAALGQLRARRRRPARR